MNWNTAVHVRILETTFDGQICGYNLVYMEIKN